MAVKISELDTASRLALLNALMPAGSFLQVAARSAPSGYYKCDRSSKSRTTDVNLFDAINEVIGTPTLSIASPCVVSLTSHGLAVGERFFFTTTGALPTGVSANTEYYVISAGFGANSFQFSATSGGSAVNSSGSQSGVHTLRASPYGIPDSSNFYLPDARGLVMVGAGAHGSMTRADGSAYDGGSVGATRNDQMQGHKHGVTTEIYTAGTTSKIARGNGSPDSSASTDSPITDGVNGTPRTGNETRPAEIAVLVCIKY